jgi:hypothetical protein
MPSNMKRIVVQNRKARRSLHAIMNLDFRRHINENGCNSTRKICKVWVTCSQLKRIRYTPKFRLSEMSKYPNSNIHKMPQRSRCMAKAALSLILPTLSLSSPLSRLNISSVASFHVLEASFGFTHNEWYSGMSCKHRTSALETLHFLELVRWLAQLLQFGDRKMQQHWRRMC